jgi:hypothetical protein
MVGSCVQSNANVYAVAGVSTDLSCMACFAHEFIVFNAVAALSPEFRAIALTSCGPRFGCCGDFFR